jgi:hypothetical protein
VGLPEVHPLGPKYPNAIMPEMTQITLSLVIVATFIHATRNITVWDKYAVSVVHVLPILLDLLANPIQALLLTPLVWNRRGRSTSVLEAI